MMPNRHCLSSGVKQGDPLSPVLFNIAIDLLLENLNQSHLGVVLDDLKFPALAYADDLALVATSDVELQQLVNITTGTLSMIGLDLNRSKSVVMGCHERILVGDTELQKVDSIKYLGVEICSNGSTRSIPNLFDPLLRKLHRARLKIGRASCRERV